MVESERFCARPPSSLWGGPCFVHHATCVSRICLPAFWEKPGNKPAPALSSDTILRAIDEGRTAMRQDLLRRSICSRWDAAGADLIALHLDIGILLGGGNPARHLTFTVAIAKLAALLLAEIEPIAPRGQVRAGLGYAVPCNRSSQYVWMDRLARNIFLGDWAGNNGFAANL